MESAQIQAGIVMRYSFEFQMHSNATNDVCLILNAHISMDFDVLLTGKWGHNEWPLFSELSDNLEMICNQRNASQFSIIKTEIVLIMRLRIDLWLYVIIKRLKLV